jgi:TRAP-type C4-dicarboxylate transport system permease small subunit
VQRLAAENATNARTPFLIDARRRRNFAAVVATGSACKLPVNPGGRRRGGGVAKNYMDRFIDSIEWIAAIFVGIVALDVFVSILLRYFFSIQIPDSYSIGQLLLGILIFWGIAATSYRGTHITVDLVYANINPMWQRVMDVFATLVLLFVVVVQTYTLFDKVVTTRADNVQTFDLRIPVWPFFAVAWIGDVAAVLLIAVRTYRLIFHPERIKKPDVLAKPVE